MQKSQEVSLKQTYFFNIVKNNKVINPIKNFDHLYKALSVHRSNFIINKIISDSHLFKTIFNSPVVFIKLNKYLTNELKENVLAAILEDPAKLESFISSANSLVITKKILPDYADRLLQKVLSNQKLFRKIFKSFFSLLLARETYPNYKVIFNASSVDDAAKLAKNFSSDNKKNTSNNSFFSQNIAKETPNNFLMNLH